MRKGCTHSLPLKKKFNQFYLKNFTQELAASIISTNTPDEEQSNPVTVKLLCSIIQHYDGHSSELMEVIKALFHAIST
ncbi:uncharacterized protein [Apostichopus japonicus]|uniref:uncharacterized protein isoform X2 n=1 Tax=Stichopus japonicus TaxID=307972 RepID=UPI003AB34715